MESPKRLPLPHQFVDKPEGEGRSTPDTQLKIENEKLRVALQQRYALIHHTLKRII
jgi:hypothetical protein